MHPKIPTNKEEFFDNCDDFSSQTEAQKVYDECGGIGNDTENSVDSVISFIEFSVCIILNLSNIITRIIHIHKLDTGGDGKACEGLG